PSTKCWPCGRSAESIATDHPCRTTFRVHRFVTWFRGVSWGERGHNAQSTWHHLSALGRFPLTRKGEPMHELLTADLGPDFYGFHRHVRGRVVCVATPRVELDAEARRIVRKLIRPQGRICAARQAGILGQRD